MIIAGVMLNIVNYPYQHIDFALSPIPPSESTCLMNCSIQFLLGHFFILNEITRSAALL